MSTQPPQRPPGTVTVGRGTIVAVALLCVAMAATAVVYVLNRFYDYGSSRSRGEGIGSTEQAPLPADTAIPTAAHNLPADYRALPDSVVLRDQKGRRFTLGDLEGSITVVDFFFARCTGPCPMMTRGMAQLQQDFANEKDVRFLSITVDPLNDTPERLEEYARTYNADPTRWRFASAGTPQGTYDLAANGFGMSAGTRSQPDSVATIFHDERYVIIDRNGGIRSYIHAKDPQWRTRAAERIRALLREEGRHAL